MKKFCRKTKAFIMAAAMAAVLLLPTTLNGQNGKDGFFSSSSSFDDYTDRAISYDGNMGNQTFGQGFGIMGGGHGQNESPLGSGLLIMGIAGASYVLLKKKEK